MLAIAISFSIKKWIGQKAWRRLHYTSYLVFGMITVHALGADTDAAKTGMRFGGRIYRITSAIDGVLSAGNSHQFKLTIRAKRE